LGDEKWPLYYITAVKNLKEAAASVVISAKEKDVTTLNNVKIIP
jgi:hypothetical protein